MWWLCYAIDYCINILMKSGLVSLRKPLDYESRSSYNLVMRAEDQGKNRQLSNIANVIIQVKWWIFTYVITHFLFHAHKHLGYWWTRSKPSFSQCSILYNCSWRDTTGRPQIRHIWYCDMSCYIQPFYFWLTCDMTS